VRRRRAVVYSHDTGVLRTASVRTRLVRLVLALASVALLAAAAASARSLQVEPKGLLPTGTTGVVIVDLSLSIGDQNLQDVRRALSRVVNANEPIGFVVFSDVPYELLPPGTPAKELRPILRLLAPEKGQLSYPWQQAYRAGTRISEALELARDMLRRDGISPGSILLLSDLDTSPDDYDKLARVLQSVKREIRVRVVPLSPTSDGRRLFGGSLGESAFIEPAELSAEAPDATVGIRGGTPVWLLVFGALCFAALAAHERFGARLALPRPAEGGTR
jgi:von Willebrand factor type A domain